MTFLFTDIERSTRLLAHDVTLMRRALIQHHDAVRLAVEQYGGVVFETVGDAVYAAFADARDALEAALDAQFGLRHTEQVGVGPLLARMAVHTGAVEKRDTQHYVGEPLIRCARLLTCGHGGQTLVSAATAALTRGRLPQRARLRDLGEHKLKDLQPTERVYQLECEGLPSTFPPLRSQDSRPSNLPPYLTSFVGRERELTELRGILNGSRLVTVSGSGGSGKTRLAIELAASVLEAYSNGVCFVDLAPVRDARLIWPTLAAAVGLREQSSGDPLTSDQFRADVLEYLRDRTMLLILDNCEHLIDACAPIAREILGGTTRLQVLATSREALGIAGERTWRVPGLQEAEKLFRERARAVAPAGMVPIDGDVTITRICERLDRIPLAIELAAARANVLSAQQIAERLDNVFGLLSVGTRDAPPRQRTLRAAIDWSYELLGERERSLWERLGVFVAGFTFEACEKICAGDLAAEHLLSTLGALVDKSLVVSEVPARGLPRYRLLETLREYALEQLAAAGELEVLQARHAGYYLALAERARSPVLGGPAQVEWLARLEDELDNLRTALDWSIRRDMSMAVRFGLALARFWFNRGHLADALLWGDRVLPQLANFEPEIQAETLQLGGELESFRDDYARSRELYRAALDLYRRLGDERGVSDSLMSLGRCSEAMGDDAEAQRYFEESLGLARRSANALLTSYALRGLGRVASRNGEPATAIERLEESVRFGRLAGDRISVSGALQDLAAALLDADRADAAGHAADESLVLIRDLGSKHGLRRALNTLGSVHQYRGDSAKAVAYQTEALAVARALNARPLICIAATWLAEILLERGDLPATRALIIEALELNKRLVSNGTLPWCLQIAARMAVLAGTWDAGARLVAASSGVRLGYRRPRYLDRQREELLAEARLALGDKKFAIVWAEGASMTGDQAIAYASQTLSSAAHASLISPQ